MAPAVCGGAEATWLAFKNRNPGSDGAIPRHGFNQCVAPCHNHRMSPDQLVEVPRTSLVATVSARAVREPVDSIVTSHHGAAFVAYRRDRAMTPLLLNGDALEVLRSLPADSIDFAMTSPPYWGKREYENGGIGLESDYRQFVIELTKIFLELKRVLKDMRRALAKTCRRNKRAKPGTFELLNDICLLDFDLT